MPPRISVAMATYNGETYLGEQLESLRAQATPPHELVVCDDRSQDATVSIVAAFARRAPFPVRLHVNDTNVGWSENFCKASTLCRGDWIAFCDQDDVWLPNKLSKVAEILDRHGDEKLMAISHSALVADEKLALTGHRFPSHGRDIRARRGALHALTTYYGFSLICRASLMRDIDASRRPFYYTELGRDVAPVDLATLLATPIGHDWWAGILASTLGDVMLIREPLVIWRRHGSSITPTDYAARAIDPRAIFGRARATLDEHAKHLTTANPNYYRRFSLLAAALAESFLGVRDETTNTAIARRLASAAADLRSLSALLARREGLYRADSRARRLSALAEMLRVNAYFGAPYHRLGAKSLAKDLYFTLRPAR